MSLNSFIARLLMVVTLCCAPSCQLIEKLPNSETSLKRVRQVQMVQHLKDAEQTWEVLQRISPKDPHFEAHLKKFNRHSSQTADLLMDYSDEESIPKKLELHGNQVSYQLSILDQTLTSSQPRRFYENIVDNAKLKVSNPPALATRNGLGGTATGIHQPEGRRGQEKFYPRDGVTGPITAILEFPKSSDRSKALKKHSRQNQEAAVTEIKKVKLHLVNPSEHDTFRLPGWERMTTSGDFYTPIRGFHAPS